MPGKKPYTERVMPSNPDPRTRVLMKALGVRPGDVVSVEPSHPTGPVAVLRLHGGDMLPVALKLLACLGGRAEPQAPESAAGRAEPMERWRRALPGGFLSGDRKRGVFGTVFVARADVPSAGIRAGDLVLHVALDFHTGARKRFRADLDPVPRACLGEPALPEALELLEDRHEQNGGQARAALRRSLRLAAGRTAGAARRGKPLRDDASPLWIVRPWCSQPVEASDDEAAVFELILGSGCRMPRAAES